MRWALALVAAALVAGAAPARAQPEPGPGPIFTAERPILLIAQLRSGPVDRALMPEIGPLKTLHDVEVFLQAHKIQYRRARAQFDTRTGDPRLVESIAGLAADDIFVLPAADGMTFNKVLRPLSPQEAELVENW